MYEGLRQVGQHLYSLLHCTTQIIQFEYILFSFDYVHLPIGVHRRRSAHLASGSSPSAPGLTYTEGDYGRYRLLFIARCSAIFYGRYLRVLSPVSLRSFPPLAFQLVYFSGDSVGLDQRSLDLMRCCSKCSV